MSIRYLPARAIFRSKPATVIAYEGDNRWLIIDSNDMERVVSTSRLIFTK